MDFQVLSAVGFGLILSIGGVAAWLVSRKSAGFDAPEKKAWRDDSLDDWRREREARAEADRQQRTTDGAESHLSTGQEEQQETQRTTHTRLGG
jgi:hypothetical protein